jgi:hypothetical protein
MKKIALILAFTLLNSAVFFAQNDNNQLSFMIGKWKGSGWMMTQNGKQFTNITENVMCKLECSVLSVEGLGTKLDSISNEQITVHDAYGVISKDVKNNSWVMRAYKKGDVIDAEIVILGEKVIYWELPIPNGGGTMRFTTDFSEANKWKGKGEFSRDGKTWIKIMETELIKVIE